MHIILLEHDYLSPNKHICSINERLSERNGCMKKSDWVHMSIYELCVYESMYDNCMCIQISANKCVHRCCIYLYGVYHAHPPSTHSHSPTTCFFSRNAKMGTCKCMCMHVICIHTHIWMRAYLHTYMYCVRYYFTIKIQHHNTIV